MFKCPYMAPKIKNIQTTTKQNKAKKAKISSRDQNKETVANIKALRINDQPNDSKITAHAKLNELQEITSNSEIYQRNLIEADTIF